MRSAVFLDRDGTLNVEKNYVHRVEDWEWIPGAIPALRRLNDLGFIVVVVSNQAGIARGLYTAADADRLHAYARESAAIEGARIDAFYYCPHHPEHGDRVVCDCRKPKSGLLLRAQRELAIDMSTSFLIGDKVTDIEAARAAAVHPILVRTGYGAVEEHLVQPLAPSVDHLEQAVEMICQSLAATPRHVRRKTADGIRQTP